MALVRGELELFNSLPRSALTRPPFHSAPGSVIVGTAMRYTDEQVTAFAESWKRRVAEERAATETRRLRLEDRLPEAAALLRRFGAEQIWLFGSLAWGLFDDRSDVDFAVRGLPPGQELDAWRALSDLLETSVDLLRIETLDQSFRIRIEREGRSL
jgi:predicted nucleotidyltransferase